MVSNVGTIGENTPNVITVCMELYRLVCHPYGSRDGTFQRHRPVINTTARARAYSTQHNTTQKLRVRAWDRDGVNCVRNTEISFSF